jgi:hypothetical protein
MRVIRATGKQQHPPGRSADALMNAMPPGNIVWDRCRPEERWHVYAVGYPPGDCNVRN